MVSHTKIIAGIGLSLGIDIPEAPGARGDYRTLLTSKATAIFRALLAPLNYCPNVFVPGQDKHKPGLCDGFDFGFLHMKAIDDAGHDKAVVFKVKRLEAFDWAIGQLARILWQAQTTGGFQYSICVTGDHSTLVEYGDHSFEPFPVALCRLKGFVGAVRGESVLLETSLNPFPLPTVTSGEDLAETFTMVEEQKERGIKAFSGDSICELNEIAVHWIRQVLQIQL